MEGTAIRLIDTVSNLFSLKCGSRQAQRDDRDKHIRSATPHRLGVDRLPLPLCSGAEVDTFRLAWPALTNVPVSADRGTTFVQSRAVALTPCGETTPELVVGGPVADAAALRRGLDEVDPSIIVGHSYGVTVIPEAGQHPRVAHLIYVSSYLSDVGRSQGVIMSSDSDVPRSRDTAPRSQAIRSPYIHEERNDARTRLCRH